MYLRTCAILDAGGLCHYAGTKEYIIDENMEVKTGTGAVELAELVEECVVAHVSSDFRGFSWIFMNIHESIYEHQ